MTTAVLHIGLHKTGTSSIQDTLAANRTLLASRGVLFPATLPSNHSNLVYDAFSDTPEAYHANRARGIGREAIAERTAATLAALADEIAAARPNVLVLSAEDACTLQEHEIARFRDTLDRLAAPSAVRIVLYARHPVDYVTSAVQENVKGNGLTLDRAKAIHIGGSKDRYRRIVGRWSAVFGESAIDVRGMERAVAGPLGLVGDALAAFGTSADGIREVRRNESIADEIVHFLAERNAQGAPRLAASDAARLFALKGNRANVLSDDERRTIWQRATDDMAFLADRFGVVYSPAAPQGSTLVDRRERLEEFRAALETILPALSPELADELATRFGVALPALPRR